jgi:tRNA (pseudouridine54-N1)-methyltransferase
MRHFLYFSSSASTSGKALSGDLMKAGRMDIVIHSIIQSLFLSKDIRKDTVIHLVFYGMPDPPKHIEIHGGENLEIVKKNVAKLIQKILYKYKSGEKKEVLPGCFVEKKSFLNVVDDLVKNGQEIFILDKRGKDLREVEIKDNPVFILGDHEGLPKKELRRLKETATPVSIGPKVYFASQTIAVVNNELDRREI